MVTDINCQTKLSEKKPFENKNKNVSDFNNFQRFQPSCDVVTLTS